MQINPFRVVGNCRSYLSGLKFVMRDKNENAIVPASLEVVDTDLNAPAAEDRPIGLLAYTLGVHML